jgi:sterol desaturase/sphingolipid hydroxylase (fatty acid hydroxylase superfamily)
MLITCSFIFLSWTLYLYLIHRIIHKVGLSYFPIAFKAHADHHKYINTHDQTKWHWNNLFLFNDTWTSTLDLWITEVIPTIIFSAITGHWWILAFYYVWAALIQETIEHNPNINFYPFMTSGKWHLIHHRDNGSNFGLFFPIWDILFKTHRKIEVA